MEQYLFHQFRSIPNGSSVSKLFHSHEFWQADFITSGEGVLNYREQDRKLQLHFGSGDTVVVPPGIEHCFAYGDTPTSWLSVKFVSAVRAAGPLVLGGEPILECARGIIDEALSPHFMSRTASMGIVDAALGVVAGRILLELKVQSSDTSEFVRRVKEFVYSRQGGDVRVGDVGEHMHCTGKHAALRFKQESKVPLKVFLDRTRAEFAGRMLRTSSKSLSEIARQLEFRDVYAFSRFFRRTMNATLSGYRAQKSDAR